MSSDPAVLFDHESDFYSDAYIRDILRASQVYAVVGASTNWNRPSYFAMKYLVQRGFRVIPINPKSAGEELFGETVVASLAGVDVPIDVVQVFRRSDQVGGVVDEALGLKPRPKVIWMQLGVINFEAAAKAESVGIKVVMNRCPKIEYARLSGELGWNGINSRVITAKKKTI
ncbi:MAG: CoA-binding protein [Alphaproteobacteria bacterium]|nr:CoA-binding protein [Alphaproteobacteria bacterium]